MLIGWGLRSVDSASGRQKGHRYKISKLRRYCFVRDSRLSSARVCSLCHLVHRGLAASADTVAQDSTRSNPDQFGLSPARQSYFQQQSRVWWQKLLTSPEQFLDLRTSKTKPTQPDFKQRWVPGLARPKALWLNDSCVTEDIKQALQELEAAGKGPTPAPSEDAGWQELFDRPHLYFDKRARKTNPKAPDFDAKSGTHSLWLNSRKKPEWVDKRLPELYTQQEYQPLPDVNGTAGGRTPPRPEQVDPGIEAAEADSKLQGILQGAINVDWTSTADAPKGSLQGKLMQHQQHALAFMLSREKAKSGPAGGMLADDQGLGKTISTIALILSNKRRRGQRRSSKQLSASTALADDGMSVWQERSTSMQPAGTLVVCPASVGLQWIAELADKVAPKRRLKVLMYDSKVKEKERHQLQDYDVVVTSYGHVRVDWRQGDCHPNDGGLFSVQWHRVVLDEAHTIKSHNAAITAAACTLQADFRWCLSGTPLQNRVQELYPYFRFLGYEHFSDRDEFDKLLLRPCLSAEDHFEGHERIRNALKTFMIRRLKSTCLASGDPIVQLPARNIVEVSVDFSAAEQQAYDTIKQEFAQDEDEDENEAEEDLASGSDTDSDVLPKPGLEKMALSCILRLRRVCNHPSLGTFGGLTGPTHKLSTVGRCEKCGLDWISRGLSLTSFRCGCSVCEGCMQESASAEDAEVNGEACSKHQEPVADVIDPTASATATPRLPANESAKLRAFADIVARMRAAKSKSPEQMLAFSSWTDMLELAGEMLDDLRVQHRSITGKMLMPERHKVIEEFKANPDIQVLLISLRAGSTGLNLSSANHVVLFEPDFNPAIEDQAIDRAHRIGQTKPVTVFKLHVPGTIESGVKTRQNIKLEMIRQLVASQKMLSESSQAERSLAVAASS